MASSDTIFALASAPGRAGVAVIRIAGPLAARSFVLTGQGPSPDRQAVLRRLQDPKSGELIDRALVVWYPGPKSFTGDDVLELHTHGGRAVQTSLERVLRELGFRLAEPGEFTRRAFENGRLDLTEAEAIADLVDAETDAQRRQALRQMDGELGRLYDGWHQRLLKSLAYLEAAIDFADEDLPDDLAARQGPQLRELADEIAAHLDDGHRGERLRTGFKIAILGPPNAGKSSLLNALARRDAAIVAPTAGTTRDVIEVHLDLGGWPVTFADTAGLRDSQDQIEREGIRRAEAWARDADLKLVLSDGATWPAIDAPIEKWTDERTIRAVNKVDLIAEYKRPKSDGKAALFLSAKTGQGLPELTRALTDAIKRSFETTAAPPLTRARHRAALEESHAAIARALLQDAPELRAEDTRLAMRALGRITGRVDVEDLLDVIFRDFCIGK